MLINTYTVSAMCWDDLWKKTIKQGDLEDKQEEQQDVSWLLIICWRTQFLLNFNSDTNLTTSKGLLHHHLPPPSHSVTYTSCHRLDISSHVSAHFLGAITNYDLETHAINFNAEILINITGLYFTHGFGQWDRSGGSEYLFITLTLKFGHHHFFPITLFSIFT